MKKGKKIIGIVIAVVIILVIMAAFGGGSSDGEKKEIVESVTEVASEKESRQEAETSMAEESSKETENADSADISIEEQVLLEWEGVTITAKGISDDMIYGKGLDLLIENDTERNIGVGCNALIVNNYMINDLFSTTVAAGKRANETVYMTTNQLAAAGITNIGQIEIYFHFYDSDSYETLYDAECVTLQTSEYANMDTEPQDEGYEVYNQDGIRIVGKYVDENSFWGTAVLLYIENTSGRNVGINCDNMSINGYMVTPFFSSTIYDGKKTVDDITILSSDLEENSIETVEDIEVNFHIYDADSYSTIEDTGAISFSAR